MKYYEFWKEARLKWHLSLGLGKKITVFTIKLAHYANAASDISLIFLWIQRIRRIRTDFDLKHTKSSLVENFNILMPR
jgi:glycyl-tRNA synthetase